MDKIGNVLLDDTHYPGEDLYSDGAVEERILKLAEEYREGDYNRVIARERDWAVMYHLAHERGNILSWYPFKEGAKVLEVGSGCGAVTGAVAAQAASVTCIDLSKRRSTINALRNQGRGNVKICISNFKDIEKDLGQDFDYATLIGVFEYGKGYIGGDRPYHEFLTTVMGHLKPGGKLLLAIENKFGLKYWAGCTEDHVGKLFEGIEGYPGSGGVRTFTKPGLIKILEECGCQEYRFYYPYPDYKFPTVIYSDGRLPQKGELVGNPCNFDRPRLVLMDEGRAFDQVLEDGLFGLYSNSFFVEITKGAHAPEQERVLYTKYSNGRAPAFAIQTRIAERGKSQEASGGMGEDGDLEIYKIAEYEEGQGHIRHIAQAAGKLQGLLQEKGTLKLNQCRLEGDRIYFEYLQGVTVEEALDRLLEQGRLEEVLSEIEKALGRILSAVPTQDFQMTAGFREVFGEAELPPDAQAAGVSDIDMIFQNLLLDGEGNCHLLDYEWTFFFPVPVGFIAYRALHYYLESASKRAALKEYVEKNSQPGALQDVYGYFGISREMCQVYAAMERNFQKYKGGGYTSVGELYRTMGKAAVPLGEVLQDSGRRRIQVYLDSGQGFSEENSYFIDQIFQDKVRFRAAIPKGTQNIRIDPAFSACLLCGLRLQWKDGTPVPYRTTGYEIEKNCFLYDDSDPGIIIEGIPQGRRHIEVTYKISILEEKTAALLMERFKPKGRLKEKVSRLIKG